MMGLYDGYVLKMNTITAFLKECCCLSLELNGEASG